VSTGLVAPWTCDITHVLRQVATRRSVVEHLP
jgi:hypothetical protein